MNRDAEFGQIVINRAGDLGFMKMLVDGKKSVHPNYETIFKHFEGK